jgi:hypothetical protein
MVAITYGIRPWHDHATGWESPRVLALLGSGLFFLLAFAQIERRSLAPMFNLRLLRIRAFSFGTVSTFLSSMARGGLMFVLIIWLQGIWLPLHGYDFADTPLWAGIYMLPLTLGMLLAGPVSGYLSDRFGARPFATGGMIGAAGSFALLGALPTNFSYPVFALVLGLNGISMGLFTAPNKAAVMNSLPPGHRGAGGGPGPVRRRVLLADDRRPGHQPAACPGGRARGPRGCGRCGPAGGSRASGNGPVRRLPRL